MCAFHNGGSGPTPPTPASLLRIDGATDRSLRAAFLDTSNNESSFTLERQFLDRWLTVATTPASPGVGATLFATDSDLEMEHSYCYRVRANGAAGSRVSWNLCGTTTPFSGYDLTKENAILHPQAGSLTYSWYSDSTFSNFQVWAMDGFTNDRVSVVTIRDHRPGPDGVQRGAERFDGLVPGKLYCFGVTLLGNDPPLQRLCGAAFATQTSVDQRGPTLEERPLITSVTPADRNDALLIEIANRQPNTILERRHGTWRTDVTAMGTDSIVDYGLTNGDEYCYRLLTFNTWGSRYSDEVCARPTADGPKAPTNVHLASLTGVQARFEWDAPTNANSYDIEYHGRRQSYVSHDGTDSASFPSYTLTGWKGFDYCIKVRAKNEYGTSAWSDELCGVHIPDDGQTSYSPLLEPIVPVTGNVVFVHTVDPGGSPPAHLASVSVLGNAFTPYQVHFLPPGSSNADCDTSKGVTIDPGSSLAGADIAKVFGSATPATPLTIVACKNIRSGSGSVDPIPVTVTYQR
jgi:hypothetical protein